MFTNEASGSFTGNLRPGKAFFNPGKSPGRMTIEGDFELQPGGVLNIEIVPDGAGGFLYDKLIIGGIAYLNGHVNFLVDPSIGDGSVLSGLRFFECLTSDWGCVGEGADFTWDIPGRPDSVLAWGDDGFYIESLAAPVPEPEAWALLLAGLGLVGWAARRRRPA